MKLMLTFTLIFIHWSLIAQIQQEAVQTLKVENELYPYKVQMLGENGLALFQESKTEKLPGERNWEVTLLDSTLHSTRQFILHDALDYSLYFTAYAQDYCYLLFVSQYNPKATIHAVRINLKDFQTTEFDISGFVPYVLKYFGVLGQTMILAGEEMHKPSVVCYSFGNNRPVILEGLFRRDSELTHIEVSPEKNYFTVYMSVPGSNRKKSITAVSYNSRAEIIKNLTFVPTRKYELLDGLYTETADGGYVMAGSYSATKMEDANGIFLAKISPDGKQTINYYNFTSLRNFFNFLPSKAQERLEEKAKKKSDQGKSLNYSVNLTMRQIMNRGDENIFIADCFNQTSFFSAFNYRWNAGLEYTHSIVACFGDDARMRWDNMLSIQEDSPGFDLQKAFFEKGSAGKDIIFNIQDDDIVIQRIHRSDRIEREIDIPLKLNLPEDFINHDHSIWTIIRPWYGRKYLVFGMIKFSDYLSKDPLFFLLKLGIDLSLTVQK